MASIDVQSAELSITFSEAYDAAPPLPRPLVSRFDLEFITSAGMLDEATSIAPLDAEEEATNDPSEKANLDTYGMLARHIKIQTLMLNRSKEFALVHQDLKNWYDGYIGKIDVMQTGISAFLSILLTLKTSLDFSKYGIDTDDLNQYIEEGVALATVVLGVAKSWIVTSGWDTLSAQHGTAAQSFAGLAEEITAMLAILADAEKEELKKHLLGDQSGVPDPFEVKKLSDVQISRKLLGLISRKNSLMGNIKGAGDLFQAEVDEAADLVDPEEPTSVTMRFRRMYREALEYRIAHACFETKYRKARVCLAFFHLLLSSITSVIMFLQDSIPQADKMAIGLSYLLTFLNTAMQTLKLPDKEGAHRAGRLAYASLQRQFAKILLLRTPAEVTEQFSEYSAMWKEANGNIRAFNPAELNALRDTDGSMLVPLITTSVSAQGLSKFLKFLPFGKAALAHKADALAKAKAMEAKAKAMAKATEAKAMALAPEALAKAKAMATAVAPSHFSHAVDANQSGHIPAPPAADKAPTPAAMNADIVGGPIPDDHTHC